MSLAQQTESVWEYPRPAICEPFSGALKVLLGNSLLAETTRGYRVLETSHPPSYYFPSEDVDMSILSGCSHHSFCEWKGRAEYWDAHVDRRHVRNIAWSYPEPTKTFTEITDYLCFYASKCTACYVNDEQVQAQEGDFYGGWITSNLKGPFKGAPGTWGW